MSERLRSNALIVAVYERIYTIFCAECGKTLMQEDEQFSEIRCEKCGCQNIRLIRDLAYEEYLVKKALGEVINQ